MTIPYEKSFASHEKAKFWSSKNELKPEAVSKSSNSKFWFNCECGHEIFICPSKICSGCWCSYCSNPPKLLCDNKDCHSCFDKSFASSDKARYWSKKNGDITPRKV